MTTKAAPQKTAAPRKAARKATAKKTAPVRKSAEAKPATTADTSGWNTTQTLGQNVDNLKNAGLTWRAIAELASANGHDIPWPDGGKLTRARKHFLDGTEGMVPAQRRAGTAKKPGSRKTVDPDDTRPYSEIAEERVKLALESRNVVWEEQEMSEEEILSYLDGKRITYVSSVSGEERQVRSVRGSRHNHIKQGKNGPYYDFVTVDGPFMAISLGRILQVV